MLDAIPFSRAEKPRLAQGYPTRSPRLPPSPPRGLPSSRFEPGSRGWRLCPAHRGCTREQRENTRPSDLALLVALPRGLDRLDSSRPCRTEGSDNTEAHLAGGKRRRQTQATVIVVVSDRCVRRACCCQVRDRASERNRHREKMAAPPDPRPSPMASWPMQNEDRESQHPLEDHEMDGAGADLDSAVAAQFIAKTKRLSISGLGNEADGSNPPTPSPAGTTNSPGPHVQPHPTTMELWREDISMTAPETALTPASCPLTAQETCSGPPAPIEPPDPSTFVPRCSPQRRLLDLPNEVLFHILGYLEVCDVLATSRVRPSLFSPFLCSRLQSWDEFLPIPFPNHLHNPPRSSDRTRNTIPTPPISLPKSGDFSKPHHPLPTTTSNPH